MADIQKTKNHNLGQEELRERVTKLAKEFGAKFGLSHAWEGDALILKGPPIKRCSINLSADSVSFELTMGLMAKMLKGKIEKEVDKKMDELVSV